MRSQFSTVFLGAGRITSALLAGLRLGGYRAPLIVHDRNRSKMDRLRRGYEAETESDLDRALAQADVAVIAVRPNNVAELLAAAHFSKNVIGVSLAAGIPLKKLESLSSGAIRWARAMPSPLSRVGKGLTALAFSHDLPAAARKRVTSLFALVGEVLEVPESQYDAFTVTYSPSHGYHAVANLAQAAVALGLDRKTALQAAAHALGDSTNSWHDSNESLDELLEEAATPGGIAATVRKSLDAEGYQRMLLRALRAGVRRAKQARKGNRIR
jgi:pyrroline-5-carboxylate reductase